MSTEQPENSAAPAAAPAPADGVFGTPEPQQSGANKTLIALGAGLVAAVIAAVVYSYVVKAGYDFDLDKGEVSITRYTYAAIGVGALIGAVIGKLGGRNIALWIVGAVLAAVAILFGELYGAGLAADEMTKGEVSAFSIFTDGLVDNIKGWADALTGKEWAFLVLGPLAAVAASFKLGSDD
ncbi:hypothetical protein AB0M28_28575 [Streptomyces sp. NPDC051940]|uniref:hypothetical protein n=1 Tax=Streptomyces sp. NPDC051940 TaxID=3155675 RepID=UPI0034180047